jgi:TldD protein
MERSHELGVYAILRLQHKVERRVSAVNAAVDGVIFEETCGVGVHVITESGMSAHASGDCVTPECVEQLVVDAAAMAAMSEAYGAVRVSGHEEMPRLITSRLRECAKGIDGISPDEEQRLVVQACREAMSMDPRIACHTSYRIVDEEWRIVRSDGTDAVFNMPRAACHVSITARDTATRKAASVAAAVSGQDASIIATGDGWSKLVKRIRKSGHTVLGLLEAGSVKAGSYRIVIDYALAKGLAHEAFGHSAESDGMDTSILGRNGKFMSGERVASDIVSIVDGPVEGDYAYQPISANGVVRRTVDIVSKGVLASALADAFSAKKAGVEPTGAGRAESFVNVPIPRMSNIRLTVADPLPMPMQFEDVGPEHVREALVRANLLPAGGSVLYLSGYKGGQVNPAKGDFVFNCSAIYELSERSIRLCQPAIFSGRVLSALSSIIAGIGRPIIDAQGTCGKSGQSVPSSGGANMFLVIDASPDIRIGGV